MTTTDPRLAISLDEARARAVSSAFPRFDTSRRRLCGIGIECEYLPILAGPDCTPAGRVRLEGTGGVIETIDALAELEPQLDRRSGPEIGPWTYNHRRGGRLTFEPGAQIEYSTIAHASVAEALRNNQQTLDMLRAAFLSRGVVLAAIGLDRWHDIETVPQQLRASRYTAMAAYFDRRGPWGRIMMRNTASMQLNYDLGPDGIWQERWLLANLLSPLMTATFACSPGDGTVALRAVAWQRLDPTRSGFPLPLVTGTGNDPAGEWAQAVLDADVLQIRLADGGAVPGTPGWTFADWIGKGHPEHGWPTAADLDYHLTTLFFEVRPRGFLELRSGDALPDHLRSAPVVLVTGALYDQQARTESLQLLAGLREELPDLWHRAALYGVRDARLADLAARTWEIALRGAERLPADYLGYEALVSARDFLDRYTNRGRMPVDDLERQLQEGDGTALAWACSN